MITKTEITSALRLSEGVVKGFWRAVEDQGLNFPKPSPIDAVMFTSTEVGEAIDAHLRITRVGYNRASSDDGRDDFVGELCDVIFMALTSIDEETHDDSLLWYFGGLSRDAMLAELSLSASLAHHAAISHLPFWHHSASTALLAIALIGPRDAAGMLSFRLTKRLMKVASRGT